jgi:hypothetical protein
VTGVRRLNGIDGKKAQRVGAAAAELAGFGGQEKLLRSGLAAERRFLSINCMIIGVKMICIASPILPPGQTMMFGRDMNESCSILSR